MTPACYDCLDKRVVLTTSSGVSFAGKMIEIAQIKNLKGIVVQLDETTGVSIFCPFEGIKDLVEVPIST